MNWLQSTLYGVVSGITEFLPVSSRAHQRFMLYIFGVQGNDPVLSLVIHLSVLLALYFGIRDYLQQIRREQSLRRRNKKRATIGAYSALSDLRVVKTAIIPLLIGMLLFRYIFNKELSIPYVTLLLAINGFILYLPHRMMHGNKGASQLSKFDSTLMGIAYSATCITGISGIGTVISVAQIRGANHTKSLNWALLLTIPALLVLCGIDLFSILSVSDTVRLLPNFFCYLLSGIGAFAAGYAGIVLTKLIFARDKHNIFTFYCWGTALLLFLLYLTVA